jgi:hypothetical protein
MCLHSVPWWLYRWWRYTFVTWRFLITYLFFLTLLISRGRNVAIDWCTVSRVVSGNTYTSTLCASTHHSREERSNSASTLLLVWCIANRDIFFITEKLHRLSLWSLRVHSSVCSSPTWLSLERKWSCTAWMRLLKYAALSKRCVWCWAGSAKTFDYLCLVFCHNVKAFICSKTIHLRICSV